MICPRLRVFGLTMLMPLVASGGTPYSFTSFDAPPLFDNITVSGIDNAGDVVGYFRGGSGKIEGFLYKQGQFYILNVPFAPASQFAGGINNSGQQIVGFYDPVVGGGGYLQGFLDTRGSFTQIPNPPITNGNTHVWGINDAGQIVGDYTLNTSIGFVYQGGTYTQITYAGAEQGTVLPRGINDAGVIVGYFQSSSDLITHGFVYQSGSFTVLDDPNALQSHGSLGTSAFGINSAGVIVGGYFSDDVGTHHGFVYSGGYYSTLDYPNATRGTSLAGINDYGVIAGTYQDAAGTHGFIGTPIAPTPMVSHIGNLTQGQPAAMYAILVDNGSAVVSSGTVSVVDTLPTGLTATGISGPGWACTLGTLTCSRSDSLLPGANYPPVSVTVAVDSNAPSKVSNQVFLSGGLGSASATDTTAIVAPFADVSATDSFLPAIDLLREYAITSGCGASPPMFCPTANITRGEMAVFVVRAIMGGDNFTFTAAPYFNDVPSTNPLFQWVQKMRDLGITSGCGPATYCPNDPVNRDQMAVFIIRARFGAAATFTYPSTPSFTDVPASNGFFPWIQKMSQIGITLGCGTGLYCPGDPVTREGMAVFLMRGAFNQLLPAGAPVITSVSPVAGPRGNTTMVTLTGQNTKWVNGTTQVTTAPGIMVTNVVVTNATTLTAQLSVAVNATPGPYSLTATTGSEEATLPNGFVAQ